MRDGSKNYNHYFKEMKCALEAVQYQKNSTAIDGIEKSQKRFLRQYLREDGRASYWWQYVLRT